MSHGHWDKWGHRRGLISSSLVFTPWRKGVGDGGHWWGCISTLVVNETSLVLHLQMIGKGGGGGGVCLRSWCAGRRSGMLKKSERRGSQTAGEQGDKWEGERGRCQASVIRAQCVFYWMTRGDGDGGRVVAQGHGWQIAALEGNWVPSMRQEWRGGKQQ